MKKKNYIINFIVLFICIASVLNYPIDFIRNSLFKTEETISITSGGSHAVLIIACCILIFSLLVISWNIRKRVNESEKEKQKKEIKISIIVGIAMMPIILLALFNYVHIEKEGIILSPLFSSSEEKYTWNMVEEVYVYYGAGYDEGIWEEHDFIIYLQNGKSYDIWNSDNFLEHSDIVLKNLRDDVQYAVETNQTYKQHIDEHHTNKEIEKIEKLLTYKK